MILETGTLLLFSVILTFRFKPLKSNFLTGLSTITNNGTNGGQYSGLSSAIENDKTNDNGRLLPMTTKASSNDDSSIEYGKKFLPPLWVDIYEEIEHHFEESHAKSIFIPTSFYFQLVIELKKL